MSNQNITRIFKGSQGFYGAIGIIGLQGLDGNQGRQGYISNTGYRIAAMWGYQGDSDDGVQGPQGYQGNFGSAQPSGPQANKGVAQVIGTGGNIGLQGLQGIQAGDGFQGFQGFQGSQGSQGLQGLTGRQNDFVGLQGTQGNQGSQGSQGYRGIQDYVGLRGESTTGKDGYRGSQGILLGLRGNQGVYGHVGFQSSIGGIGTQGFQGSKFGTAIDGFKLYEMYDEFFGDKVDERYPDPGDGLFVIESPAYQGISKLLTSSNNIGAYTTFSSAIDKPNCWWNDDMKPDFQFGLSIDLATSSNNFTVAGLTEILFRTSTSIGVLFHNIGGNWVAVLRDDEHNLNPISVDTGIPADEVFHQFRILYLNGRAKLSIDDILYIDANTKLTNIPLINHITVRSVNGVNSTETLIDYMYLAMRRSTISSDSIPSQGI